MSAVQNIPTRFALVKRAEKLLKEIDDYFEEAANFGLSVDDADPRGEMVAIRKGLVAMLEREGRLRREGTWTCKCGAENVGGNPFCRKCTTAKPSPATGGSK